MTSLIGVGDNTVDTYIDEGIHFPGGNAVNVAVFAGRCGGKAAYLGALGDDSRGRLIQDALNAEKVDISHCRTLEGIQNAYVEVKRVDGEREFGDWLLGASSLLHLDDNDLDFIRSFDLVHSSIFSNLENQIEVLKKASSCLSFDFSTYFEEREMLKTVLPHVDIAIFSAADLEINELLKFVEEHSSRHSQLFLMTQGEKGSWVLSGSTSIWQDIVPTKVVDTMGAGDAFIASFLVEYYEGAALPKAMQRAAEFAAESCQNQGAFGYGQSF
ncbi:MAG: hypothetical protein JEZ06_06910 [Anaerolineaceae bacterium]|nr:hypothetical protein [Anaerolineaceae bacterium]